MVSYKAEYTFDDNGNELIRVGAKYYLRLKSEDRRRFLGETIVDGAGTTWFLCRRKENHVYKKLDAWGFNNHLLEELYDKDRNTWIGVATSKRKYWIAMEEVKYNGIFLNHKKEGFELQVFMKRNSFGQKGVQ